MCTHLFRHIGITSHKSQMIIFEVSLLSRKVMLFARSDEYDDNDNENQSLLWWTTCNGYFLSLKGKLLHLIILQSMTWQKSKGIHAPLMLNVLQRMENNLEGRYPREAQCRSFTLKVSLGFQKATGQWHIFVGLMRRNGFFRRCHIS